MRDATALANICAYIRNNPAHWDVMRYGEPRFMMGNRALLDLPKTAFLASRGAHTARAPRDRYPAPACIISGFLSPMERVVFEEGLDAGTPMVQQSCRRVSTLPLTQGCCW
ncbi:MAG: hypothetical protein NTV22_14955 [bacterium]|nr:hypothetical protein [bacterium]